MPSFVLSFQFAILGEQLKINIINVSLNHIRFFGLIPKDAVKAHCKGTVKYVYLIIKEFRIIKIREVIYADYPAEISAGPLLFCVARNPDYDVNMPAQL